QGDLVIAYAPTDQQFQQTACTQARYQLILAGLDTAGQSFQPCIVQQVVGGCQYTCSLQLPYYPGEARPWLDLQYLYRRQAQALLHMVVKDHYPQQQHQQQQEPEREPAATVHDHSACSNTTCASCAK